MDDVTRAATTPVEVDVLMTKDIRTVLLSVTEAPLLYTPSGKAPMVPTTVEMEFNIATSAVRSLVVRGRRCDDGRWHRSDRMARRVTEGQAPLWLVDLVEEWRP